MASEHKTYEIVVEPREVIGKSVKKLRRRELLPAVVYGHNIEAQAVQVPMREMERVYLHAGSTTLVDLKVGEGDKARKVFIHEVQRDPVSHALAHVDFMVVNLLEEMTVSISVILVGEAPAVHRKEGLLLQALDHLQVRALPADLPASIEVDISGLEEVDSAIHVADVRVPENVAILTAEEELIAKVTELPVEEVVEVEEEEAAQAEAEGEEAEGGQEEAAEES